MNTTFRKLNRENKLTFCYGVTENNRMKPLLESNYDSCLDGRGVGANVGVLKCNQIISKQNSKLKKIGKRKKSGVLFQAPSAGI